MKGAEQKINERVGNGVAMNENRKMLSKHTGEKPQKNNRRKNQKHNSYESASVCIFCLFFFRVCMCMCVCVRVRVQWNKNATMRNHHYR